MVVLAVGGVKSSKKRHGFINCELQVGVTCMSKRRVEQNLTRPPQASLDFNFGVLLQDDIFRE